MSKNVFLSIIIPSYNEKENIERNVLSEVWKYMKTVDYSWEVIVSDDGSNDGSLELAREKTKNYKNFKVLANPHGGKPSTLLFGVRESTGKYILFTDMDQSTPISELGKLFPFLRKGYDVVIGSRGLIRKDFPLYRKLGASVFSTFRRLFILPEIVDTQCGFKLFETMLLQSYFPRLEFFKNKKLRKGWVVTSWDVEFLHMIKKAGVKVREVRVVWNDRDESKGKGSPINKYFKESWEMVLQILRVKINDVKGVYS